MLNLNPIRISSRLPCRKSVVVQATTWMAFWATFAILLMAPAAYAVDGVLEINQVCATTNGCFPSDPGGFPVAIANPGSYRLTGNLQVPDASTSAITITAEDVTLDLNGFALLGVTTCTGDPVTSCTPIGSPASLTWAGSEIAGCPVMFQGGTNQPRRARSAPRAKSWQGLRRRLRGGQPRRAV